MKWVCICISRRPENIPKIYLTDVRQVSWIRGSDIKLLSVGRYTYTTDLRFEGMSLGPDLSLADAFYPGLWLAERVTGADVSMWRDSPEILTRLETGPQWGHRQWFRWEESSNNHRNRKLNFRRMISHSWKLDRKLSVLIFLRPSFERKYQVTLSYIRKIANTLKVRAPYFGSI